MADCMERNTNQSPGGPLRVTLVANAGVLLEYGGVTLLLDGIYGPHGHPFSNLTDEVWQGMLHGKPPFERIDYLLFTHQHPDHFSPEMTAEFLAHRKVKGVFLPDGHAAAMDHLKERLGSDGTPCVLLSHETDHAAYRIEPGVEVRAFSTLHLDKKYHGIPHFCYVLSFGEKRVLFTADVDYTEETFENLHGLRFEAVFVNPLFFNVLRHDRFFRGRLDAGRIVIYHVPFSGEDEMRMRPALARDLVEWPPEKQEADVLCMPFQTLEL